MASLEISGVVAPVFTPFNDDGSLNLDVIPEYMQFLVQNGVRSILVGGTTGEAVTMSLAERKAVLTAWLNVARPLGAKIIFQVGGVPLPDVLELARYAEETKPDAIMTLPELYYKPRTPEQLVEYLAEVSRAAPSMPLVYYHFPMMTGVDVNIPKFFKLATSKIPNFKAMKADLNVAIQVNDILGSDQRIFIGNHMLAPAVLLGHDSSIATVTNMFPELVQDIVNATDRGDVVTARAHQLEMNRLVAVVTSTGDFQPSMKAAMTLITGIKVGPPRHPIPRLDEDNISDLVEKLSIAGISTLFS